MFMNLISQRARSHSLPASLSSSEYTIKIKYAGEEEWREPERQAEEEMNELNVCGRKWEGVHFTEVNTRAYLIYWIENFSNFIREGDKRSWNNYTAGRKRFERVSWAWMEVKILSSTRGNECRIPWKFHEFHLNPLMAAWYRLAMSNLAPLKRQ